MDYKARVFEIGERELMFYGVFIPKRYPHEDFYMEDTKGEFVVCADKPKKEGHIQINSIYKIPGLSRISNLGIKNKSTNLTKLSEGNEVVEATFIVPTIKEIANIGHPNEVKSIAYHPDGKHLATASSEGGIRIFKITKSPKGEFPQGKLERKVEKKWEKIENRATTLNFSPNGKDLYVYTYGVPKGNLRRYEIS